MPKAKEQGAARPTRTTVKRVQATEGVPFNPPQLDHHPEPDTDETGEEQLTPKQRRFVEAYTGPHFGCATKAAELAGYRAENRVALASTAHENLRKPQVQRAIARRLAAMKLDPG